MEAEKLEGMSVVQLKKFADEKKIVIPTSWRKGEIVDEIKLRLNENGKKTCPDNCHDNEEVTDMLDDADAMSDRAKNIEILEKDVADAAVVMVRAQANAKAAKKEFDTLAERLSDFLNRDDEPSLFDQSSDDEKKCRKCECTEDAEHFFATDNLCQYCADNLGKEDTEEIDEPEEELPESEEVMSGPNLDELDNL